jgi:glycosyltransferase involved in cell wall biosynthesis
MRAGPLVQVLCAEARERAIECGTSVDRIVEANLPLPVERYPNIGVTSDTISRWLIPARFVEKKGHAVLFDAFRMLIDEEPQHSLTCWGGYGDSRPLQNRIDQLGLQNHVRILSNKKDGPFDQAYVAQLQKHDAVIAPSIRAKGGDDEGGPALTAVLAQVAGKPVVFSNFPGSERSVTNGIEGYVVPQNDPQALARAMKELAADPERARSMGQAGRETTMREFSRRAYRDALLSWYKQLLQ